MGWEKDLGQVWWFAEAFRAGMAWCFFGPCTSLKRAGARSGHGHFRLFSSTNRRFSRLDEVKGDSADPEASFFFFPPLLLSHGL